MSDVKRFCHNSTKTNCVILLKFDQFHYIIGIDSHGTISLVIELFLLADLTKWNIIVIWIRQSQERETRQIASHFLQSQKWSQININDKNLCFLL